MAVRLELVLEVEDDSVVDYDDASGLTEEAYDRLMDSLIGQGFSVAEGPHPRSRR